MYYFHYQELWTCFLTQLGFKPVVSPPTNKAILELGLKHCVDGACVAIKSYIGHALFLAQQGVPRLFVPQIISVYPKEYTCPNLLGLPDLLRQYLPTSTELLTPILDGRKGEGYLARSYRSFGEVYASRPVVKQAWGMATRVQRAWEQGAYDLATEPAKLKILVLGPRYLTDDPFLSGNIFGHLQRLGAEVYTAAQVPGKTSHQTFVEKRLFWSNARQSLVALEYLMERMDGVVTLSPFGCGAEAFVGALVERQTRGQLPHLGINLDEHTSMVGLLTRLEAFCDLLERKKSG